MDDHVEAILVSLADLCGNIRSWVQTVRDEKASKIAPPLSVEPKKKTKKRKHSVPKKKIRSKPQKEAVEDKKGDEASQMALPIKRPRSRKRIEEDELQPSIVTKEQEDDKETKTIPSVKSEDHDQQATYTVPSTKNIKLPVLIRAEYKKFNCQYFAILTNVAIKPATKKQKLQTYKISVYVVPADNEKQDSQEWYKLTTTPGSLEALIQSGACKHYEGTPQGILRKLMNSTSQPRPTNKYSGSPSYNNWHLHHYGYEPWNLQTCRSIPVTFTNNST
jgi:hypothetical protein